MNKKYLIPRIPAQKILLSGRETEEGYLFSLDLSDSSRAFVLDITRQDDCPIFHQAIRTLFGENYKTELLCEELREVFIYVDFSGIFDRSPGKRVSEMQEKAKYLFGPSGFFLDFGRGEQRYIAFERSASMSRNSVISFVREDVYEPLRKQMMLGMKIGMCQLSKLYAYNALLFTSGRRIQNTGFLSGEHIIVIDNPQTIVKDVPTITVEDDGTDKPMRRYYRMEKKMDIEVTEFDGEGFISPRLAKHIDHVEGHPHHSFQIRLPYIKGVVHEVDFAGLFAELGVSRIVDIWGQKHDPKDVDMILTKSMFKGFGWMTENGLSFGEYLERCREYGHALYISGEDKLEVQETTELNYQFLNTLAMTQEEFRPKDLPLGWTHSPREDVREWVTKATENAYYDLVGAAAGKERRDYFLAELENGELEHTDRRRIRAELAGKNPLFLEEHIYEKELTDKAKQILSHYADGQLLIAGDNRYLSDDLLRLLAVLVRSAGGDPAPLEKELLSGNTMYAPMPGYAEADQYTLLRSPHIARNEEALAVPLKAVGKLRKKYLSHLRCVVMVDSRSLIPERLGGADYDGDMIKTISDPLINRCVLRSSQGLPLLKIPAAEPLLSDAEDWSARFATVKSTFSSRVGQISNTALRRGIIAYDENGDDSYKENYRRDVEVLSILTGLEIDSAKSGIKPDLTFYLGSTRSQNLFLKYKSIVGNKENREWYEPTIREQLKEFFTSVDWEKVTSNLEKLPYYAKMLESETAAWKPTPASDEQLFSFAEEPGWKDRLDPQLLDRMKEIIDTYEAAGRKTRVLRHLTNEYRRSNDVFRILFARGQESDYHVDELYEAFSNCDQEQIREMRHKLEDLKWQFTPPEKREQVLWEIADHAYFQNYTDLFCDFRFGGYRLLGDIICDLHDMYRQLEAKKRKGTPMMEQMMRGTVDAVDYKAQLISNCLNVIQPPTARTPTDFHEALKCAVALGKRAFVLEVLTSAANEAARAPSEKPKKRRRLFR